ncbi:putative membrane protein [Wolbachia endosymbiont of Drosophila ananassae]|nr:putative membrane protein [Wolbachia endosymbiont of Drosophila ananassae]RLT60781.1 putative membrane protein [Wolbachia endosymbiont of Drosophila ananassae]RLT62658.1 putative membrane protein [Wolbachia endosymbiont of Drosophila ananassae]
MSSTGMTPFVVNSLLLYGLAAILNGYKVSFIVMCSSVKNKT